MAQIERYCLNLQSVLFTLSVFPEVRIPDEVLDGFFDTTGELIYVLHHLARDNAGEGAPRLRCAPSGLRGNESDVAWRGGRKCLLWRCLIACGVVRYELLWIWKWK